MSFVNFIKNNKLNFFKGITIAVLVYLGIVVSYYIGYNWPI